ncbi:MAG: hypothetical protein GX992_08645 [Clostridium sp.]|nr:hypothetical protein [Clostridium sp.]
MKVKLLINSIFYKRNIVLSMAFLLIAYLFAGKLNIPASYIPWIGMIFYIALVMQSFTSEKFQDRFLQKNKWKKIRELNRKCVKAAHETVGYANAVYYRKLTSVMADRAEIVRIYNKDKYNHLKGRVTEQALRLIISYMSLLRDLCIRIRQMNRNDINPVMERIAQNNRKINFVNDPKVREDIKRIIEMDERLVNRHKEEKSELMRLDARLDCIKSTVGMFRHQIGAELDSDEVLEDIENVLNEAMALDSVLNERRNERRLRN